jgi:23S rRNA (cytosine1962-C5)-methyltransferase
VTPGVLRLKRGRDPRARLHPWIFKGDVADVTDVPPGGEVIVIAAGGQVLGRGLFNPRPALCCRMMSWQDEPIDDRLLRHRIERAVARRRQGGADPALARLVWSEADGLPGFVADRYAEVLVVQCFTLAMAQRRASLAGALAGVVGDLPVFAADDPGPAGLEGFEPVRGWLGRPGPAEVEVAEGRVRYRVRVGEGQKTGLYLDQRDSRLRVGGLAHDRTVLDAFAYAGGFSCHALAGGARRAVLIESSPEALAAARENLRLNGVAERAEVVAANAFDELRRRERTGERFDLVVLDPPPFARGREAVEAAARGYKEINLRAMRLLAPGGLLLTFSCSHHVTAQHFEEICRAAAADAGVTLRVRDPLTQAADHPILLTIPETRYLKGLLLEAA